MQTFELDEAPYMSLFIALNQIRETQAIYEGDRCIECGCCVASCGAANLNAEFAGPAGLNRMARFMMDPHDSRGDADWFEVVSNRQVG